jgi:hypothetical protein
MSPDLHVNVDYLPHENVQPLQFLRVDAQRERA